MGPLASIAFNIQENFYGQQNEWYSLYIQMGRPLYLTTFIYLFGWGYLFLGLILLTDPNENPRSVATYLFCFLNVMNVLQEIWQIMKKYPDTHGMDILAGFVAMALFWVSIFILHRKKRSVDR